MNWNLVIEALKWTGIVLLAGFIGQFGKSLALHMIERKRKRMRAELKQAQIKPKVKGVHKETVEIISNLEKIKAQALKDKAKAKAEKKKSKVQVKTEKKKN